MIARSFATSIGVLATLAWPLAAGAQIVRDGSIGPAGGALAGPNFSIPASLGLRLGDNVFHSFSQFNIGAGESATFSGPGSVANIISRVTGPSGSSINGTLRSTIAGANFWLINPHGIAFGPSASLDVQGSVHLATADYVRLGPSGQFNATNPGASTLAAAPPSAFGFLGPPAPITVNGSMLAAANGKGIYLAGGDINLTSSTLQAAGGRIDLASQGVINAADSTLDVSSGPMPASGGIRIVGGHFTAANTALRADNAGSADGGAISLELSGALQMTGGGILSHADGAGRSADISVRADSISLLSGAQLVSSVHAGSSQGGDISVQSAGAMRVDGAAGIFQSGLYAIGDVGSLGPAGVITVQAGSLELTGGGVVTASARGAGAGGNVSIAVSGPLTVRGETSGGAPSAISASAEAGSTGAAGSVSVRAGSIEVLDGGHITAGTAGAGAAGNVEVVSAGRLRINGKLSATNYSSISATSELGSTGAAGTVTVTADSIRLQGDGEISADTHGSARGGDVRVSARTIDIVENGNISAIANRQGPGGDVTVSATQWVSVSGRYHAFSAGIYSQARGQGDAGSVSVSAPSVRVSNDGTINASTYAGGGRAGDVTVEAERVSIRSGASIESSTFGAGPAGTVAVSGHRGVLVSSDGGRFLGGIFSDSVNGGTGNAGTIRITAGKLILTGNGEISTDTDAAGAGGDISVVAGRIALTGGGDLSSTTYGSADAGNISLAASERLHISGESAAGAASGIFASAEQGIGNAGTVSISARRADLTHRGLISTSTFDSGRGGDVRLSIAERLRIVGDATGHSGIFATSSASGAAGNIAISAGSMSLRASGTVSSAGFAAGKGGDVQVDVAGPLLVAGSTPAGGVSGIFASSFGSGEAGNIAVTAGSASLLALGTISSSGFDSGRGGDVQVDVRGPLVVSGSAPDGGASGIFASSSGSGDSGRISVSAASARITGLAAISSTTFGTGRGGNVDVAVAGELFIAGRNDFINSGIFAASQGANSKESGSVRIRAGSVVVRDGGAISASSRSQYDAGAVQIAAGSVRLIDHGIIVTRAEAGAGGNIDIRAGRLVYLKDSSITTSVAGGAGNGGNITIDPEFVVLDHSQIVANAFGGNGGNIRIVADNFLNQESLVQASSQLGVSGNIRIDSPRVDVSGALRVLSTEYLDASRLIRGSCASRANSSTFMAGGRGGLAAAPRTGQEPAERRPVALGCGPSGS